jgi:predicted phage terminase large subunit-like protein
MDDYFWAAMYQQSPIILGGNVFKDTWLKHWAVLPEFEYRMIYADTAQKTAEHNDYSVLEHWAKGKDGKIYLIDMIRGKWEAPQLMQQALAYWSKCKSSHGGTLRKLKVEDKSSGTGLIQQLRQAGIPVEGIPRGTDKLSRAYDVAPMIEAGNVLLPTNDPHLSDMLLELAMFPRGLHDDTIDPMMDAISDMLIKTPPAFFIG